MGRHSKDYIEGYEAAIEAIKTALKNSGDNDSESPSKGNENGDELSLPSDILQPPSNNKKESGEQGKTNGSNKQKNDEPKTRDSEEQGKNHGVVRAEDCMGPNSLNKVPGQAGGMIDKQTGDEIAEKEGYEKEGGSESSLEREWKEATLAATKKMKGNKAGDFISRIEGLYKTSQDWKKDLKRIVGASISPEEKRQAYANKNILISQNRIARTDKDKYDNLDYMMAWIDSSGSMSDEQLKMCLSEVYAVALAKKPVKLIVIQCDTRIQSIEEYTNLSQLKKDIVHATVKGRGGTNLKPCWDLLKNDPKYKRRTAELVMVFTDGWLDQYKRDPRTMKHLCWVILDNPGFNIQYKDINTKCVHLNTENIK